MANYEEQSDGFTYDVFLSFRGEDTRHNIVGYLLDAFEKRGINVFYDDKKLELGEDISPALFKAIEESNISVIVFSKNYASSRWCLDELAKIMECTKRNNKQIAFPIFYHVDPSDVRHQRNSYGEAMVAQQKRFGKDSEKIKAWAAALSQVADLKGHHIDTGFEIDHVKEIAEKVYTKIPPISLHGENPIGLDQRIEEVKSLLDLKPNDNTVCMLGIYGLGGLGKTNLAKALYNKVAHQFQAACFLANVREKSNKINGLEDLQLTLLSEMFEKTNSMLGSTSRGIMEIKLKLGKIKVLLVLDDVIEMNQLDNLAGGSDWFGPGSRIIITTRDKGLLISIHQIEVKTYEMTELNDQHSLELFCRNAFGKSNPKAGYEVVSSRAVGYAKGLPLALKVIGSNLATRKSLKAWEDALKDYERIPRKGIQDVLEISYDVLEPCAQSVFLDIACFFKGEKKEYVEEILSEFSAASNIEELVNKSLLNVEDGYLYMHDLIQDMGREIVRKEAPNNPAKRSRLWLEQDVIDVLSANDSGSDAIQGIMLDPPNDTTEVYWNGSAFEKMHRLRVLIVRRTTFSSEPKYLPNHLRLLEWEKYPSKTFPPNFYPMKVIMLNLFASQLTMEEPFKHFSNLTVIDFPTNESITAMPDVSKVANLRELRLDDCLNLTTVHESIGFLKHLVHLSVSKCYRLENFLQRMFLPSLEVLNLDFCSSLEHFPNIVDKMNKPLKIQMIGTSIKKLPNSVDNLIGLVSIDMEHSLKLEYLPSSLFRLPNIVAFKFSTPTRISAKCFKLGESFRRFLHDFPSQENEYSTLKTIDISNCGLLEEDIQTILTCFPKLEELMVSDNYNLVSIPVCINLRILNVCYCTSLTHISELPCTIQKIDASHCLKFSSETSDMLWDQVKKERHGLEIVIHRKFKVPEWFDYRCKGGVPCFWVCGKFPNVALALLLQFHYIEFDHRKHVVQLHLVINGEHIFCKRYYEFSIRQDHVLVCDLRLLYNDEEWLSIDALLLKNEWNQVQISYEVKYQHVILNERHTIQVSYEANKIPMTTSEWGVFVYKQGTDDNLKEHVQFMCPDPTRYLNESRDDKEETKPVIGGETQLSEAEKFEIMKHVYSKGKMDGILEAHSILLSQEDINRHVFEGNDDSHVKESSISDSKICADIGNEGCKDVSIHKKLVSGLKKREQELLSISNVATEVFRYSKDIQDLMCGIYLDGVRDGVLEVHATLLFEKNEENDSKDEPTNFELPDEMKSAIGVGEVLKYKIIKKLHPLTAILSKDEILTRIFMNGMGAGLREAQSSFPSLDIDTTMIVAYNRGEWVRLSVPVSGVEMKIYMEGVINGLLEAKVSIPTLKESEILNTVLRKEGHNIMFQTIDWTEIVVPRSDDPLLESFMMMKQGGCDLGRAESKLFCKLLEEHNALRKKIEEIENESATTDNSKKGHSLDEKLATVLKGRAEQVQRLYDDGIEEFQNSKEIHELMTATYSNGMRDGLLEARAILLALDMDRITHEFEWNENEISAQGKDSRILPSKNQYGNFLEKLNTQFGEHISKKDHTFDGNDDSCAKESSISDSKIRADIGKEGCKDVSKQKKLAAVLKEREEELLNLYDAEIEEFQNSEEIQDLMCVTYLNGLRYGVLEAHASLLSLFEKNEENDSKL